MTAALYSAQYQENSSRLAWQFILPKDNYQLDHIGRPCRRRTTLDTEAY
jgi:hypothetical protein